MYLLGLAGKQQFCFVEVLKFVFILMCSEMRPLEFFIFAKKHEKETCTETDSPFVTLFILVARALNGMWQIQV